MRPTGRMHSATLDGSPRLKALLRFLEAAGARGATAREIRLGCGVEAVSAAVDELRDNGVHIPWSKPEDREGCPRKVYVYRLAKFVAAPPPQQIIGLSEADKTPLQTTTAPPDEPFQTGPQGQLFGEVG